MSGKGYYVVTPEGEDGAIPMNFYRLATLKSALALELRGMKLSRARAVGSAYVQIKRELGWKGSRQKIYDRLCQLIEDLLEEERERKGESDE
jgi:hypothetical protein